MDIRSLVPFGWPATRPVRQTTLPEPFERLHHEIDEMFGDFFRGNGMAHWAGDGLVTLPLEVSETDREIVITAELPGVAEKDVEVTLSKDLLTIKGEKRSETEKMEKSHYVAERCYGAFSRSLRLPYTVDDKKVAAKFKNGVLTVTLPKPKEVQESVRKIEVKTAA